MHVEELKAKCLEMIEQKKKCESIKQELKEENLKLESQRAFLAEKLEELGLKKFDTGEGVITRVEKFNVRMENKQKFFDHLREKGIFEDLATVNFQTLNRYYKDEMEIAIEEGAIGFDIPGVEVSSNFTQLQVRGAK